MEKWLKNTTKTNAKLQILVLKQTKRYAVTVTKQNLQFEYTEEEVWMSWKINKDEKKHNLTQKIMHRVFNSSLQYTRTKQQKTLN